MRSALEFAEAEGIRTFLEPLAPFEQAAWYALRSAVEKGEFDGVHTLAQEWLERGDLDRISALYPHLGTRDDLPLPVFLDEGVGGFMTRIGDCWESGELSVMEEHLVSQAVIKALLRVRDTRLGAERSGVRGPNAMVGAISGNQHHLGALCIRLLLEELGFAVAYLGPDVPLEEFARAQQARGVRIICVSIAPPGTVGDVVRCVNVLETCYSEDSPYSLLIGGGALKRMPPIDTGSVAYSFEHLRSFPSTGELAEWIEGQAGWAATSERSRGT